MNPTNEDQPETPQFDSSESESSGETANDKRGETREAFQDLGSAVKRAFRAGARDARDAAKRTAPKVGEQFRKGVHDVAYGVAYLASFGCALIRQITPDPIADGLSEGAEAGREAAEKMAEKRRQAREKAESEEADTDTGDAAPATA